jgi:hypothetical protein
MEGLMLSGVDGLFLRSLRDKGRSVAGLELKGAAQYGGMEITGWMVKLEAVERPGVASIWVLVATLMFVRVVAVTSCGTVESGSKARSWGWDWKVMT